MKKIILSILLSIFLFTGVSFSQNGCGTYDGYLQDEINKYPLFYKSLEEKDRKLEEEGKILMSKLSEKENDSTGALKIIPVVVHIIHNFGSANVTDADVHYALEQLNKNINRQADNMLTTPDVFAAVSGSANVEFRLAKLTPFNPNCDTCTARPTNGIVRINSELTEVPVNEAGNNLVKTLSYWNSYSYFNIWVVTSFPPQSDGNTLLGYAQFPWSGRMSTDGVAIKASEFKNGRTLTHEVGHWLGLRHIWGDALCGDDDIFDTPVAKEENWNVPISAFPYHLNVCEADSINPAGEMFMNYMDYSDDNVMSLFTDGQVAKMNETLEGTETEHAFRKHLWSDSNLIVTGTADGFVGAPCRKKVDFIEQYGNTTTCVGGVSSFKGNKNIFPSNASLVWDFGDGNTNSGDNTPNHSYTEDGIYDVTLTIEYDDDVVAKAYSMDDIQPGHDNLETIVETKIIEGTMEELNEVNATNITLHLDDSNYSIDLDTLFFRGEYQETYYLAHYSTTCVSSVTKQGLITVLPESSSNTNDSYTFSFEGGSTLEDDFIVVDNKLVVDWDFNVSANPKWERVDNVYSHGKASIMINGKKLTSANPIIFETHSYDLEDLTEPAISFDYIGAAISSFPTNYLTISYSKECGVWKELETLLPEELSSAGYFSQNFIPDQGDDWNNIIMFDEIGVNDLQSKNVRFKFEYFVEGLSNRLYIDNIRIGEESDLLIDDVAERFGFSVAPNPLRENTNIILETNKKENIEIKIFNILGSEVATIFNNEIEAGYHTIPINFESIEDGIYFISILTKGEIMHTNKIIVQ